MSALIRARPRSRGLQPPVRGCGPADRAHQPRTTWVLACEAKAHGGEHSGDVFVQRQHVLPVAVDHHDEVIAVAGPAATSVGSITKAALSTFGVTQSMGRVGSCFDNAVSEAFNSVLKVEYVHRHAFRTRTEARIKIATWITDFYNAKRLHSACGFKSPIDYERDYRATLAEGLAA